MAGTERHAARFTGLRPGMADSVFSLRTESIGYQRLSAPRICSLPHVVAR